MTDPSTRIVQDAPPGVSTADAELIAGELFGVHGTARSLGSNQDLNFVIAVPGAAPKLLKIANPATTAAELEAQSRAARVLAAAGIRAPQAATLPGGTTVHEVDVDGRTMRARLLDFLEGRTLSGGGHLSHAAVAAIGRLAASVDRALAGVDDPAAERVSQWDLARTPAVLPLLVPSVADAALRWRLERAADAAWAQVAPLADRLPVQTIHGDLTDDNVVVGDALAGLPDGVIDLGDLCRTWRVAELAITVSSLLHHDGVGVADAMRAVTAYHAALPLDEAEVDALWPLVVLRATVLVASAHRVLRDDPGNDYAADNLAHELAILAAAQSVPLRVGTALARLAAGSEVTPLALPAPA
ncbi:MAG: phosphotransferase, partial [Microbacterium sp.]